MTVLFPKNVCTLLSHSRVPLSIRGFAGLWLQGLGEFSGQCGWCAHFIEYAVIKLVSLGFVFRCMECRCRVASVPTRVGLGGVVGRITLSPKPVEGS